MEQRASRLPPFWFSYLGAQEQSLSAFEMGGLGGKGHFGIQGRAFVVLFTQCVVYLRRVRGRGSGLLFCLFRAFNRPPALSFGPQNECLSPFFSEARACAQLLRRQVSRPLAAAACLSKLRRLPESTTAHDRVERILTLRAGVIG